MSVKYNKKSGHFLPGVPARDLSTNEVTLYGGETRLINTGLYEKPRPKSNKARHGPSENKGR